MAEFDSGITAAHKLLEAGALVAFEVMESDIKATAGGDALVSRVELQLGDDDGSDAEWGALGFVFALAVLSYHDARPRGSSHIDFEEDDEFNVADLFDCLRFERGGLHFSADYIRGRCMKNDVEVRPDGRVTIETRGRGDAVLRWLDHLKGRNRCSLYSAIS